MGHFKHLDPCHKCGTNEKIYNAGRYTDRYQGYVSCPCGTHLIIPEEDWNTSQAILRDGGSLDIPKKSESQLIRELDSSKYPHGLPGEERN